MAGAKGLVLIAIERCKGCGMCTAACPADVLQIDNTIVNVKGYNPVSIIDMSNCIGCGNCGIMCPDNVLTVKRLGQQRRVVNG